MTKVVPSLSRWVYYEILSLGKWTGLYPQGGWVCLQRSTDSVRKYCTVHKYFVCKFAVLCAEGVLCAWGETAAAKSTDWLAVNLLVCLSAIDLFLLCRHTLNLIRVCKYGQFTKAVEEFSYSSSFDFDASIPFLIYSQWGEYYKQRFCVNICMFTLHYRSFLKHCWLRWLSKPQTTRTPPDHLSMSTPFAESIYNQKTHQLTHESKQYDFVSETGMFFYGLQWPWRFERLVKE